MPDRNSGGYAVAVVQPRLTRWMRARRWNMAHGTIRRRLYDVASNRAPWWDWGRRVMALTGTDFGGNWQEPKPPTWWYRRSGTKRMWRTGYPRRVFQIVTDYDELRALTEGLNEDQMYEWSAISVGQYHDLHLGHRYWGGNFYGLPHGEWPILRRYLLRWWVLDWFGARSWLYSQGLHAAVYVKRPRSCQVAPPKGSGGYDHWLCQLDRGHAGVHRYRSMTWGHTVDGRPVDVVVMHDREETGA